MARFDVYRMKDGETVVDCQADIHRHLDTRFIIPLVPFADDYPLKAGLNPIVTMDDARLVLVAEFASTVFVRDLRKKIGTLDDQHDKITRALDFLTSGF
jgi:toxin CcdB